MTKGELFHLAGKIQSVYGRPVPLADIPPLPINAQSILADRLTSFAPDMSASDRSDAALFMINDIGPTAVRIWLSTPAKKRN